MPSLSLSHRDAQKHTEPSIIITIHHLYHFLNARSSHLQRIDHIYLSYISLSPSLFGWSRGGVNGLGQQPAAILPVPSGWGRDPPTPTTHGQTFPFLYPHLRCLFFSVPKRGTHPHIINEIDFERSIYKF